MQLTGYSLELVNPIERESVVQALRRSAGGSLLVLNTCQRLECFGFAKPRFDKVRVLAEWKNAEAFERLSRIAAGLESRVLGELEVLGQVREAYRQYRELDAANDALLDRIFQDVLTLARKARRESGIDQKVTSLSALASQALLSRINPGDPIAVVGSGSLAGSVARYLSERGKSPIRIAGRCPENAMRLALRVQGFGCGLDNLVSLFKDVSGIITATAAPHPVVYTSHLAQAKRPLVVVDLGAPPDCAKEVLALPELTYIGLEEVEGQSAEHKNEREERARAASRIIRERSQAWALRFRKTLTQSGRSRPAEFKCDEQLS